MVGGEQSHKWVAETEGQRQDSALLLDPSPIPGQPEATLGCLDLHHQLKWHRTEYVGAAVVLGIRGSNCPCTGLMMEPPYKLQSLSTDL